MEARAWIFLSITPAIAYQITTDRIVNVILLFYALVLLKLYLIPSVESNKKKT